MWILNPTAILLVLISLVVSILFYRGIPSAKERLISIGSMTQSIVLLLAFIMPIFYLRDLSDIEAFGHNLNTTLVLVIIGISINIICKVIARFK